VIAPYSRTLLLRWVTRSLPFKLRVFAVLPRLLIYRFTMPTFCVYRHCFFLFHILPARSIPGSTILTVCDCTYTFWAPGYAQFSWLTPRYRITHSRVRVRYLPLPRPCNTAFPTRTHLPVCCRLFHRYLLTVTGCGFYVYATIYAFRYVPRLRSYLLRLFWLRLLPRSVVHDVLLILPLPSVVRFHRWLVSFYWLALPTVLLFPDLPLPPALLCRLIAADRAGYVRLDLVTALVLYCCVLPFCGLLLPALQPVIPYLMPFGCV